MRITIKRAYRRGGVMGRTFLGEKSNAGVGRRKKRGIGVDRWN